MLVRDIRPPIQRVIHETAERTAEYYKRLRFVITTSKYGSPILLILLSLIYASVATAINNDTKNAIFKPASIISDSWQATDKIYEIDLGEKAKISEFNDTNSSYIYFSDLVGEQTTEDEETPDNSIQEEPATPTGEGDGEGNAPESQSEEALPQSSAPQIEEQTIPTPQVIPMPSDTQEPQTIKTDGFLKTVFSHIKRKITSFAQDEGSEPPAPAPVAPAQNETQEEQQTEESVEQESEQSPDQTQQTNESQSQIEEPQTEPAGEPDDTTVLPTIDGESEITAQEEPPAEITSPTTETESQDGETANEFPAEEPEQIDTLNIYTSNEKLLINGFAPSADSDVEDENLINEVAINFSLAMEGREGEDDIVLLEYSFGDDTSNQLDILKQDQAHFNSIDGDYLSYKVNIQADTYVSDLENLNVRITHLSNNDVNDRLPVLVDAVWLDVNYLDNIVEGVFAIQLSDKNAVRANEEPELRFRYVTPRGPLGELKDSITFKKNKFQLKSYKLESAQEEELSDKYSPEVEYDNDEELTMRINNAIESLEPGTYTVQLELEENGKIYKQDVGFQWGVLAINTNKS